MGFFKDLKDDLSQAVNELIPMDDDSTVDNSDQMVNTLDSEAMTDTEEAENEMKEWLEGFMEDDADESISDTGLDDAIAEDAADEVEGTLEEAYQDAQDDIVMDKDIEDYEQLEITENGMEDEIGVMNEKVEVMNEENLDVSVDEFQENVDLDLLDELNAEEEQAEDKKKKSEKKMRAASAANEDDVTVISKGTTINGSISSDGSLDIMGSITGDVECLGKLSITGKIIGNSTAAEVYINTERLEGSVNSEGSVKVGLGTVVIGDIIATSGVIAGAVKGEIDINGPVVIDSTAIIKGNIKAKSVQINNGAVVDGYCSLSYADVDLDNVFE
ncbi:MAG TPA: polymer-forming cytoskeletal protein [Clostridiales bacterium]|jgi:cytoskeletal protein CcmA (bactofilin family)|nr:polymer-forming cytoskeletal protein [Clostridiales bacterium]